MKILIVLGVATLLGAAGCTTKSKARLQAREAFVAGQEQALTQMRQPQMIMVVGDVQNRTLPWNEELTLASAIVAADFRGRRDPKGFLLRRNGETFSISAKQLLQGEDFPLQPGDTIEIVP